MHQMDVDHSRSGVTTKVVAVGVKGVPGAR
jgi:hypothetical protein